MLVSPENFLNDWNRNVDDKYIIDGTVVARGHDLKQIGSILSECLDNPCFIGWF